MVENTRKMISVSENNYLALKRLGTAGDSFNDVLNELLWTHKNDKRLPRGDPRVAHSNHPIAVGTIKTNGEPDR